MIESLSQILEPSRPVAWPEDAAIPRERWENLTARLINIMDGDIGMFYAAIQRDTGIDKGWLDRFLSDPHDLRGIRKSIWSGEKTALETNVDKLESFLIESELRRNEGGSPRAVDTGVTRRFHDVAGEARELCTFVLFDGPPGIGKSHAVDSYIRLAKLNEGFLAPVWKITLDEYGLTHKSILGMIGEQAVKRNWDNRDVPTMKNSIRAATAGRGGMLIIDEGQHLGDADIKQGVSILNGLRSFCDAGCFGIVLIGNGEIYRKLAGKPDRVQLFSRLERSEVSIGGGAGDLAAGDVRAIAEAWQVEGADAYALSWSTAKKPGALRGLVKIYARARREYGVINYDTMIAAGAQA